MFDYDRLILNWDDNDRHSAANNFILTLHKLDVYTKIVPQTINGTYFEKEWMSQLHWDANEFIDTLTKLGLTPDGSRPKLKVYFWKTLNPF